MQTEKMAVSRLVIVMLCVPLCGAYTHFQWSDCGSDPNVRVERVEVTPMPVIVPGPMHLTLHANLSRSISNLDVHLAIKKETFLLDIPIPCLANVGSCTYQMSCGVAPGHSFLDRMISEDWAGVGASIGRQVQSLMQSMPQLHTEQCPVPPASVAVDGFNFNLPGIPGILSSFANGDYSVKVTAVDKTNGGTLLCMNMHLSVHEECHGFLCG